MHFIAGHQPVQIWRPSRSQFSIHTNERCHRTTPQRPHTSDRVFGSRSTRRPKGKERPKARAHLL